MDISKKLEFTPYISNVIYYIYSISIFVIKT